MNRIIFIVSNNLWLFDIRNIYDFECINLRCFAKIYTQWIINKYKMNKDEKKKPHKSIHQCGTLQPTHTHAPPPPEHTYAHVPYTVLSLTIAFTSKHKTDEPTNRLHSLILTRIYMKQRTSVPRFGWWYAITMCRIKCTSTTRIWSVDKNVTKTGVQFGWVQIMISMHMHNLHFCLVSSYIGSVYSKHFSFCFLWDIGNYIFFLIKLSLNKPIFYHLYTSKYHKLISLTTGRVLEVQP